MASITADFRNQTYKPFCISGYQIEDCRISKSVKITIIVSLPYNDVHVCGLLQIEGL